MANSTDKSILTAAGKALLAQLNAEEKALVIDKMIFANVPNRPEYPQPDDVVPTDHIVHQEQVEQRGRLSADSVIYSTTLTSDVGPFEFNWTGAYCSEYGVLVTVDHHALTPKTADEPGVAGNTLVRSVVLEYKDIAEITNITVDASSWQYNATERMKKMDSDVAQSIIDQNGKDWFIEDGFLVTPSGSAYNIKAGAGYVSGNRVAMEFDRSVQVPNKPSFIYIDAHREGTPTAEQVTIFNFVVTSEEKDDYIDSSTGKDVKLFVCKIAQVLEDGSVSDLRPEPEFKQLARSLSGNKYFYTQKGKAFDSSELVGDPFASWTHATVSYDEETDDFVIVYNTNTGHNINTNSVLFRTKPQSSDAFSYPQVIASDKGNYSYKCQASGIALNGDYVALIARLPWGGGQSDATYVYRSKDKGATWQRSLMQSKGETIVAFNGDVSGFLVTLSGRILTFAVESDSYKSRIFYSDDNGESWEQSFINGSPTDVTEPAWCDIGGGRLLCIARAAVRMGTTEEVIPAKFMTSNDNGSTWTEPKDSKSIRNFTLSNGEMVPDYASKTVEFIHHSRFTEADGSSSILISRAEFDKAFLDQFSQQVRVAKLAAYIPLDESTGDSGYIGAKRAKNGVINAFYYTGKRTSAQINYLVGTPDSSESANDALIDWRTGEKVTQGSNESKAIDFTPIYENGQFNPKYPFALKRAFAQGKSRFSFASIIMELAGSQNQVRESISTVRKVDFSNVEYVQLMVDSFTGDGDIGVALYNTQTIDHDNPAEGRMFFSATSNHGKFIADTRGINGVYYLHVVLTGQSVSRATVSQIALNYKGANSAIYQQTFNRVAFKNGYGFAGRDEIVAGGDFGQGSGDTNITGFIELGATSSVDGVRTRTLCFNNEVPEGVSLVSADLSFLRDEVGFDAGIALYETKTPIDPKDGRLDYIFVNNNGTVVLDVPSQRPLYLHIVANASGQWTSNIVYVDNVVYM